MTETIALDTKQETASPNGHKWKTFDDDQAFLKHVLSKKPAEELVDVPEWEIQILCRAMDAESRIDIQMKAYDEKTKRTDFRRVFYLILMAGCYNPTTGRKFFTESARNALMREQDGAPVERLAMAILRLSGMLPSTVEQARKN